MNTRAWFAFDLETPIAIKFRRNLVFGSFSVTKWQPAHDLYCCCKFALTTKNQRSLLDVGEAHKILLLLEKRISHASRAPDLWLDAFTADEKQVPSTAGKSWSVSMRGSAKVIVSCQWCQPFWYLLPSPSKDLCCVPDFVGQHFLNLLN